MEMNTLGVTGTSKSGMLTYTLPEQAARVNTSKLTSSV